MSIRRRKRIPIAVPIASIGDIAFLLIIFFILTSDIIQQAHVKLDPPRSAFIAELEPGAITVSMDEEGSLWLQGQPCAVEALAGEIEALRATREEAKIILKIHKDLVDEQYGPVRLALADVAESIYFVGEKTQP